MQYLGMSCRSNGASPPVRIGGGWGHGFNMGTSLTNYLRDK